MRGDLRRYAVANARVRALLSALLGRAALEALYSHPSPEAMWEALGRTPYPTGVATAAVPGAALLYRLFQVGRLVLETLEGPERRLLHLYLLHHEVDDLLVVIRAVYRRLAPETVAGRLHTPPAIATVAARSLLDAADLRDLQRRLGDTPYADSLRISMHRLESAGPFALEVALELDYWDRLWAAIESLQAEDRVRARHLLGILLDLINLSWIARYRDVLGLAPEEVLNYTVRQGRWISAEIRAELARTPHRWSALERTPYAPLASLAESDRFETAASALWRFLARETQRMLAQYPFHIGVPLAFLLAQEIEIRDLRVLLAAKSIGVAAGEALDQVASGRP